MRRRSPAAQALTHADGQGAQASAHLRVVRLAGRRMCRPAGAFRGRKDLAAPLHRGSRSQRRNGQAGRHAQRGDARPGVAKTGDLAAEPGWWSDAVQEHFSAWEAALPLVARLGLPDDCGAWPIQRLSTGERLRLGLLRGLMLRSRVLLLDEPTSALDSASAAAVEALIAERVADGTGVLWSTHDNAQARRVGTRIFAMRHDGGIQESRP